MLFVESMVSQREYKRDLSSSFSFKIFADFLAVLEFLRFLALHLHSWMAIPIKQDNFIIFVCGLAGIFVIFVDNVVNVLNAFDSVHASLWNKYLMKWIAVMFPQNVQLHKINIKRLFFIK